jgi:hypothetical protein
MNRKVLGFGIAGLIVIILAAGAFTAVRLLSAQNGQSEPPAGAMVLEDVRDDGSGNPVTVRTVILPAPELPDRPADAGGVLKRQEDNSYFVGTGSISVDVEVVNGESSTAVNHSGPEVEVVVSHDTQFYRDVTDINYTADESKEQTFVQEIVLVDQPQTMPDGANFQAWGEQRGDRVVADIVVFSEQR